MKLSLNLLKKYFETNSSPEEISNTLTSLGLEVEGIVKYEELFNGVVVGHVLKCEKHPNADRLNVCIVKISTKKEDSTLQIVCGAKNVRAGLLVPVSIVGTTLPNGITIKKSNLRGFDSEGMICSAAELCVGIDSEGIMELKQDSTDSDEDIGRSFSSIFFENDIIFDVSITPNRGDWASIIGIARELQAKGLGKMKPFFKAEETWEGFKKEDLPIALKKPNAFAGIMVQNVKNQESPNWLKVTLRSIGLNPKSAIVDISNYIMFVTGLPVHIYDADMVNGGIIVDELNEETTFKTLKDEEVMLPKGLRVVFDSKKPLCILGIMGGKNCAITNETKNIIIECAYTPMEQIVACAKTLGIQSEARYRTERGVDYSALKNVASLVSQMITETCGGEIIAKNYQDNLNLKKIEIEYNLSNYKKISGQEITQEDARHNLEKLGFLCNELQSTKMVVSVPFHRTDCSEDVDLTEEIIRLKDINQIPISKINLDLTLQKTSLFETNNKAKKLLLYKNYKEVINYLFVEKEILNKFGLNTNDLSLVYPINNCNTIQNCSLPNLLKNISHNIKQHSVKTISFMESTAEYQSCTSYQNVISGVKYGSKHIVNTHNKEEVFTLFDIKVDLYAILEEIYGYDATILDSSITPIDKSHLHPFSSFEIIIKNNKIAEFGTIHPKILEELFEISSPVFFFKIFIDSLTRQPFLKQTSSALNQQRDISFIVNKSICASELIKTIKESDPRIAFVTTLDFFIKDEEFGPENKSITLSFSFNEGENLNKEEIMEVMQKIEKDVKAKNNAQLRGVLSA